MAAAVGEHQAQRQEHQRAQQQLLVGQSDKVPAFLIKIGEGGNAEKSPHGSEASSLAPEWRLFFSPLLVGSWCPLSPNPAPKGAQGTAKVQYLRSQDEK